MATKFPNPMGYLNYDNNEYSPVDTEEYYMDPSDIDYRENEEETQNKFHQHLRTGSPRRELEQFKPLPVYFSINELSQPKTFKRKDVGGTERKYTGRSLTPNEDSASRLDKALQKHAEIPSELRRIWRDEMVSLPQIQHMNMETLANTLILIKNCGDYLYNPDVLNGQMINILNDILPANVDKQNSSIAQNYKATFLRYIRAIEKIRNE